MHFEVIGDIVEVETIAVGPSIREVARLHRRYGRGRWCKLKGIALIPLTNGQLRRAEIHWYEAHGIDRKEMKRKRYVDEDYLYLATCFVTIDVPLEAERAILHAS